jgi:inner membrane protein
MKARTHDLAAITGLTVVVVTMPLLPPLSLATILVAILANQLGGIAPDIDQPTAPLWRNLPIGGVVGRMFDKLLGGHRFLTHSLIGVVLMGFLFHLLLQLLHPIFPTIQVDYVWWAFMIGMASHLIMDSFTKEGVPWLLPIPIKFGFPPLKKLRVTTGKSVENFIVFPLLLIALIWIGGVHYHQLVSLFHNHAIS